MKPPDPKPDLIFPIVGAFFRPPSVSILKNLPLNTPLFLHADPANPVDPNAIGVWISKSNIPFDKIKIPPGTTMEYNRNDEFHIGFLQAVDAEKLNFDRSLTIIGQFRLSDTNKPMVKMLGFKNNNAS